MDLTWFNQLAEPLQTILLGGAGGYMAGMAADVSGRFLGVLGRRVQKQFKDTPRQLALNLAMAQALHETVSLITDDPELVKHYLGIFDEWMKRDDVIEELSQVIDPRPDSDIDLDLLALEFEAAGLAPELLGEDVEFNDLIARFIDAFYDAALLQEELQEPVKIGLLRNIAVQTHLLVKDSAAQRESLDRIAAKVAPDMSLLRRHYLQRIIEQYRYLPLRGLDFKSADAAADEGKRVDLCDVYIQLDTTASVERAEKELRSPGVARGEEGSRPLAAREALIRSRRMVLLGKPGSGKSTFVSYLCLCLAGDVLEPNSGWRDRLPDWSAAWRDLLPVPVVLRELAAWIQKSACEDTKTSLLTAYLKHWLSQRNLTEFFSDFHQALRDGRAILLLDGLDEVPLDETLREAVIETISDLPAAFPDAPMLATCRVLSYQDHNWRLDRRIWSQFELADLSVDKIDHFINAWYEKLQRLAVVNNAAVASSKLLSAVRKADLVRLARNPLLLTVMAIVHTHKGELPDARAMLYEDVIDMLLWRWEAIKLESDDRREIDWRQLLKDAGLSDIDVKRSLWALTYEAHGQIAGTDSGEATADIPESMLLSGLRELHPKRSLDWADQMIRIMKLRAGLLLEGKPGIYNFPHRTFEEYLAGCHLSNLDLSAHSVTLAARGTFWWEVILLAVGRLVHLSGDYDKPLMLVNELCPQSPPALEDDAGWRNVWLAGQVLLEIGLSRAAHKALGRELLRRVPENLVELAARGLLKPRERAEAGTVLGLLDDPRSGVGSKNGLPDIEWIPVEAGPFIMGSDKKRDSDADNDETPQFNCTLVELSFRISRYPVTVAQYQAFIEADGYQQEQFWTPAGWKWRLAENVMGPENYSEIYQTPNHPRVGVSWYEAAAFCNWLSDKTGNPFFLPTEAQWEKAARGTDGRIYPWGDEFDSAKCNMGDTKIGSTSAVGIFPGGNAECGAADLSGNVFEWCRSRWLKNYDDYQKQFDDSLEGEAPRVLRGGSFCHVRQNVSCADRISRGPSFRFNYFGFRVVSTGF